jgi:hypothetical protein
MLYIYGVHTCTNCPHAVQDGNLHELLLAETSGPSLAPRGMYTLTEVGDIAAAGRVGVNVQYKYQ